MHTKVKDSSDLVRDDTSKAILNTNNDALSLYRARRNKEKMLEEVLNRYDTLQNEVTEIKQLLRTFLEKNST